MAKTLTNLFAKTEAGDNTDLDNGRIVTQGVGLRQGELAALQEIAAELGGKDAGVTVNGLMHQVIRLFLVDARAGKTDPRDLFEEQKQPKLKRKHIK